MQQGRRRATPQENATLLDKRSQRVSPEKLARLLEALRTGTLQADSSQNPYRPSTIYRDVTFDQLTCSTNALGLGDGNDCLREYTRAYQEGRQIAEGGASEASIIELQPRADEIKQTIEQVLASRTMLRELVLKQVNLVDLDDDGRLETYNELVINYFLNTLVLRRLSQGFVLLVDFFRCFDAKEVKEACRRHMQLPTGSPKPQLPLGTQYIIIEGADMDVPDYLAEKPTMARLRVLLVQMAHALDTGWRAAHFVHHDLHVRNMMLSPVLTGGFLNGAPGRTDWLLAADAESRAYDAWRGGASGGGNGNNNGNGEPWYFLLQGHVTDGRALKLIDFGRSTLFTSTDPTDPTRTNHHQGLKNEYASLGIRDLSPSLYYDMRRFVFDLMANTFELAYWKQLKKNSTSAEWLAWIDFCDRAIDIDGLIRFVYDNYTTLSNKVRYANAQRRFAKRWAFVREAPRAEAVDRDMFRARLFEFGRASTRVPRVYEDAVMHTELQYRILRDDPRRDDNIDAMAPDTVGMTPRDVLAHPLLDSLRRTQAQADALMEGKRTARIPSEYRVVTRRINLTFAEAGTAELLTNSPEKEAEMEGVSFEEEEEEEEEEETTEDSPWWQMDIDSDPFAEEAARESDFWSEVLGLNRSPPNQLAARVGTKGRSSNSSNSSNSSCAHCGLPRASLCCTGCQQVRFCSEHCARLNWKQNDAHRTVCGRPSA